MAKFLSNARIAQLRDWVKSQISSAIGALSDVYSAAGHKHTKSDITDLANATATKGGLLTDNMAVKLNGIAQNADVSPITKISVNGTEQTISSKKVDIEVPTKTSDLTNDSNFVADASYVHTDVNFTSAKDNKLTGIAANAQVNVIETVKVNGTKVNPTSKAVDITVPTNTNQLANGAGFQTASDVQGAIATALGGITSFEYEVVQTLPATGAKGKIYLVANQGSGQNIYDEYIWITDKYEKLGTKELDLSGYLTDDDVQEMTEQELANILNAS